MRREDIISKGYYTYPQVNGLISVKQFIVLLQDGEKRLLLRMANDGGETVTGFSFRVLQYDAAGRLIGSETVEERAVKHKARSTFHVTEEIPLADGCVDFRVALLSVQCGSYLHTVKGEEVLSSYLPEEESEEPFDEARILRKMKGERHRISSRTYRPKLSLILICSAIVLMALLATAVHLAIYMSSETLFTLDNVDYRFETDDHVSGPICITGYHGSARNLVIPEQVEGHKVSRIEGGSFSQTDIRTLVIEGETVIDANAFSNCHSLESVSMTRVPKVGAFAFSNCTGLHTVTMGANGSVIDNFAFMGCSSLKSVTLPTTMEAIGNGAFASCASLESMILPDQLTDMGEGILYDCSSLRALSISSIGSENGKGSAIDALFTTAGTQRFPTAPLSLTLTNETAIPHRAFYKCEYLESLTVKGEVTSVGEYAFSGCKKLKEVHLPEGVALLGSHAFEKCEALEVLDMGTGLEEICDYAFSGCRRLKALALPKGLKTIGNSAFLNCSSLQELTVPSTVTKMGINFLQGCSQLTDLTLPFLGLTEGESAGLSAFMSSSNCSVRQLTVLRGTQVNADAFAHYKYIREIKLPDTVETIGDNAFLGCTALETVNLSRRLASVGSYAFKDCSSLQSAMVPATVLSFGEGVFEGCVSLQSASLPSKLTTLPKNTFFGCRSLESIEIPQGVTVIEDSAFQGCEKLKKITLPSGLTELKAYAFSGCSSLGQIVLPAGVTTLMEGVFADCTSLSSALLPITVKTVGREAFRGCASLRSVTLPDGVERIDNYAFRGTGLTEISLSNNLKYVGVGVFENCNSMQSLTVPFIGGNANTPNTLDYLFATYPSSSNRYVPSSLRTVTVLGGSSLASRAFYNCKNLTAITLPSGLNAIGEGMLYGCSSLQTLTIPQGVESIASNSFFGCRLLKEIALPDGLKTIGEQAFQGCYSLQELTVPKSVTSIGSNAFSDCTALGSVTIPFVGPSRDGTGNFRSVFGTPSSNLKTVTLTEGTALYGSAFYGCNYLTTVNLPDTLTEIGDSAFYNCSALSTLTLPEGLRAIGSSAFYNCRSLQEISLPDVLKGIGDHAFSNCVALEDVTLPDSVDMIGVNAFSGCTKLKSITLPFVGESRTSSNAFNHIFSQIPETLTTVTLTDCTQIPYSAFSGCSNLTSIILPEGLERINAQAFSECHSLTSMVVPTSVTSMGRNLFRNCYALEELSIPFLPIENGAYYGSSSIFCMFEMDNPEGLRRVTLTNTTEIPNRAFSNCYYLEEVVFEKPITSIGEHAFSSCYSLKEIELPESLNTVGRWAFEGCYRLYVVRNHSDLTFDDSQGWDETVLSDCALTILENGEDPITVTKNGFVFLLGDDGNWYLVDYTGSETKLSLPESFRYDQEDVTSYVIPRYAFRNNKNMTELRFSSAVSRIRTSAFASCENLRSVTIPHSMREIEYDAFHNCVKLEEVYNLSELNIEVGSYEHGYVAYYALVVHTSHEDEPLSEVNIDGLLFKKSADKWFLVGYEGDKTELVLDSFEYGGAQISSYKIMKNAFSGNGTLTSVTIGRAVSEIGESAFASCYNLKTVTFAEDSQITSLPFGAFQYCNSLTSVTLPSTLKTIGEWTFGFCHGLTEIMIPKSVEELVGCTFYNCTSLRSVTFESGIGLKRIGYGCFFYCPKLKEMILPEGLTRIEGEAFYDCSALEYVSLPSTLEIINDRAFIGCRSLLEVVNLSSLPITVGSTYYGNVARYALAVHSSQADRLPRKTITEQGDTYYFIYHDNSWYLYAIEANPVAYYDTLMTLPTWTENDKTVSYAIIRNSLRNLRRSVLIPAAVTSIDADSQNTLRYNVSNVYYGGTEQQWKALVTVNYSGKVLYYADCVHDSQSWTYVNGSISTSIPNKTTTVTKAATCKETGVLTHQCTACSKTWTETAPTVGHTMDGNYQCTVCQKKATKVTSGTVGSLSGFRNDANNPFIIDEEGRIQTGSVPKAVSSMQLTADRDMTISLQCKIENGMQTDRWQFYVNGRIHTTTYGNDPSETTVHIELKAGEILSIRYRNQGGSSTVSSTGIIQNFYIL